MARNKSTVYLGFEDEEITSKHAHILNNTVNKIGGTPDWPGSEIKIPNCPLCFEKRPLLVQLYAPLENSQFHRTLYIFVCVNPSCSNKSKSWLCIRVQQMDTVNNVETQNTTPRPNKKNLNAQKFSWCSGEDDWGIEAMDDTHSVGFDFSSQNNNEENGNIVEKIANDNSPISSTSDDEESYSMDSDVARDFGNLKLKEKGVKSAEEDNRNANSGIMTDCASGGSASAFGVVNINSGMCCAEIEDGETDAIYVETPKAPERDLIALMKHTSTAAGSLSKISDLTLKPFFISVDEEVPLSDVSAVKSMSADHIRDLYQEYKRQDEISASSISNLSVPNGGGGAVDGADVEQDQEIYEKSIPAHGDVMFYHFVSTIQNNPGQILRYSRDTLPLLIAPLCEPVPKCQHCNGETICEVQILSTIIPKLRIQQNNDPAPIEYGNVLTFTCLKSCWDTPDKMRYEKIIVQQEI